MDKVSGKLTVFFEEPFWVGVFERVSDYQTKSYLYRAYKKSIMELFFKSILEK